MSLPKSASPRLRRLFVSGALIEVVLGTGGQLCCFTQNVSNCYSSFKPEELQSISGATWRAVQTRATIGVCHVSAETFSG